MLALAIPFYNLLSIVHFCQMSFAAVQLKRWPRSRLSRRVNWRPVSQPDIDLRHRRIAPDPRSEADDQGAGCSLAKGRSRYRILEIGTLQAAARLVEASLFC